MYLVFGISHKTARIDIRERYFATSSLLEEYYRRLDILDEVVILSTCNRFEVYGYSNDSLSLQSIKDYLFKVFNILPSDRKYFYFITSEDAIDHLFRVVSGIDSKLVGECQIYDQVKKSYYYSLEIGRTGYFLNKLFQRALFVSGKVRSSIPILSKVSIGSIVRSRISENFEAPRVLLIGTGEIALHLLKYLRSLTKDITIASTRHLERAVEISKKFSIKYCNFEDVRYLIDSSDVLITATSCPFKIVDDTFFTNRISKILIFDLSVPRNVMIENLNPNIVVYNIDDLNDERNHNLSHREEMFESSRKIISVEVIKFMESIKCDLMKRNVVIGSRGSNLAKKQVEEFINKLLEKVPSLRIRFDIRYYNTTGDIDKNTPIYKIEGSDFFTDLIEQALIDREIDIAVHSAKDLPDIHKDGIITIALTPSEDRTDCLVVREDLKGYTLSTLPKGSIIGVSSRRRIEQIRSLRPDLITKDIRGNIEERLAKLDSGEYDGVIMATIALKRLGLTDRISEILDTKVFDTHPLQGSLAIQIRNSDIRKFSFLLKIDSRRKIVFDTPYSDLEDKLVYYVNKYYWQKFIAFKRDFLSNPDKIIKVDTVEHINDETDSIISKVEYLLKY